MVDTDHLVWGYYTPRTDGCLPMGLSLGCLGENAMEKRSAHMSKTGTKIALTALALAPVGCHRRGKNQYERPCHA